jgi:hypothetical protein
MRYRIITLSAIALAMLALHGCGDDTAAPAPATTNAAKPAAAPAATATPAPTATPAAAPAAAPAATPAAPATPAK